MKLLELLEKRDFVEDVVIDKTSVGLGVRVEIDVEVGSDLCEIGRDWNGRLFGTRIILHYKTTQQRHAQED